MRNLICQNNSNNLVVKSNGDIFKYMIKFIEYNGIYTVQTVYQSILHTNIKIIQTLYNGKNELTASLYYRKLEKDL